MVCISFKIGEVDGDLSVEGTCSIYKYSAESLRGAVQGTRACVNVFIKCIAHSSRHACVISNAHLTFSL